jgi:hypothetical protein
MGSLGPRINFWYVSPSHFPSSSLPRFARKPLDDWAHVNTVEDGGLVYYQVEDKNSGLIKYLSPAFVHMIFIYYCCRKVGHSTVGDLFEGGTRVM